MRRKLELRERSPGGTTDWQRMRRGYVVELTVKTSRRLLAGVPAALIPTNRAQRQQPAAALFLYFMLDSWPWVSGRA